MPYIVSARKYRPKTFDEVVGQRAVTNVLKKAIEQNRLAQALLFTGPRGVGKTSCARIMAREVNKPFVEDPDSDLSFNIFELDAASNNSVDDIRELIEQVRIPPQIGKYKVYIIDEVHMLSNQAFNAFLKTLEEPPEHAIFILATTEKHKIIPTILSRCQIFDFKRISVTEIKEHLKKIAEKEGIQADDDALFLIAQKADGSLRDALSAFDKIVSVGGKQITRELVSEHLGILDYEIYFNITDHILNNNKTDLLLFFNRLVDKGVDIHHFIGGLATHFRSLLMATEPATVEILEMSRPIKEKYLEQSAKISPAWLLEAMDVLTQADLNFKMSQHPLMLTEIALLKITDLLSGAKKKTTDIPKVAPSVKQPDEVKPETDKNSNETGVGEGKPSFQAVNEKKESEKVNKPKASLSSTSHKSTGILSVLKKTNKTKTSEPESLPDMDFTPEDFLKYWKDFLQMLYKNNDKQKFLLMSNANPRVEGTDIILHFGNDNEIKQFQPVAEKLLPFLKKHLQNSKISFQTRIVEKQAKDVSSGVTYYTRHEKQSRLIELNEEVAYMIKKFKLQ